MNSPHITVISSGVQWVTTCFVRDGLFGAVFKQTGDTLMPALVGGDGEAGPAYIVLGVYIGTQLQEFLHGVHLLAQYSL